MGGGIAIAAMFICLWAPVVLLAGHVGLLVDRVETRALLVAVSAGQALVASPSRWWTAGAPVRAGGAARGRDRRRPGRRVRARARCRGHALAAERERNGRDGPRPRLHGRPAVRQPARRRRWDGCGDARRRRLVRRRRPPHLALAAPVGPRRRTRGGAPATGSASSSPTPRRADGGRRLRLAAVHVRVDPCRPRVRRGRLGFEDIGIGIVLSAWTLGMLIGSNVVARRVPLAALASAAMVGVAVQGLGKFIAPFWLAFGFMVADVLRRRDRARAEERHVTDADPRAHRPRASRAAHATGSDSSSPTPSSP